MDIWVGTHESGEVSAPIDCSLVKTLDPASRVFILSKLLESCFTRSIILRCWRAAAGGGGVRSRACGGLTVVQQHRVPFGFEVSSSSSRSDRSLLLAQWLAALKHRIAADCM